MRRFSFAAGLLAVTLWLVGNGSVFARQQGSSSQNDAGQAVPDAPQPQKKPAEKTQDPPSSGSSKPPSDGQSPGDDTPASPDDSSDKAADKPAASSGSKANDNPFPEDISRKAAQQDNQPADSDGKAASPGQTSAGHTSADDNPFPEDVSRQATKAAGNDSPSTAGDAGKNSDVPKVPAGVSSSDSSSLPVTGPEPKALEVTDAPRAKKDTQVGDFYLAQGNVQGAYDRYKDGVAYDPTNVNAIFGLAQAAKELKQYAEARRNYMLYLEIVPNGPKAKQALKALSSIVNQH
jgi:Tetratricopeptide repeat